MAGGDGSLVTMLMKIKEKGINVRKILFVSLPYGTGNDFCKVTNWGCVPSAKYYKNLNLLVTEICTNSHKEGLDIWDVMVTFRKGGDTFCVNSRTKQFEALN